MTVAQLATFLNVSPDHASRLVDTGMIPSQEDRHGRFVERSDATVFKDADDAERRVLANELTVDAQRLGLEH